MTILETERTFLRTFEELDLEALKSIHFDADVMRFLGGGVRTHVEDVRADLERYMALQAKSGFSKWAIIHKENQEFMGRAGLVLVPETNELDLGYALHKKYWNQGYATEIAQGLLELALNRVSASRIIGIVIPGNQSSIRVLEKIGFSFSGKGHYFGMNVDVYRLLQS